MIVGQFSFWKLLFFFFANSHRRMLVIFNQTKSLETPWDAGHSDRCIEHWDLKGSLFAPCDFSGCRTVKKRWKSPRNRNADVSRAYERRSSIKSAGSGAIKFTDLKNPEFYFQIQRRSIDRSIDRSCRGWFDYARMRDARKHRRLLRFLSPRCAVLRFYSLDNLLPLVNKLILAVENSRKLFPVPTSCGKTRPPPRPSSVSSSSLTLGHADVSQLFKKAGFLTPFPSSRRT